MNSNEFDPPAGTNPTPATGLESGAATLPEVDEALKAFTEFERRIESLRATAADVEKRERRLAEQERSVQAALADATRRNAEAEERAKHVSQEIERVAAA